MGFTLSQIAGLLDAAREKVSAATAARPNRRTPRLLDRGLNALLHYPEQFRQAFAGFRLPAMEILQQIAECDRVVTRMVTQARQLNG